MVFECLSLECREVSRSSRGPMNCDRNDFRRSEFAEPNSAVITRHGDIFRQTECAGSKGEAMKLRQA